LNLDDSSTVRANLNLERNFIRMTKDYGGQARMPPTSGENLQIWSAT